MRRALTVLLAVALVVSPAGAQTAADLVGRWGLAGALDAARLARAEPQVRAQCGAPYVIAAGRSGGAMMHLPDDPRASELVVKSGWGGTFIGPPGPAGGPLDRKVLRYDGRTLILEWVDPTVATRYGTMVFARCGRP
jgi:hypothetical protein